MSFPTFDVNNNRSDHTGTFNIDGELHSNNIRINASGSGGGNQPVLTLVSDTILDSDNATYIAARNTADSPTNLYFQGQRFYFNNIINCTPKIDVLHSSGSGGLEVGGKDGGYLDFTYGATTRSYRDDDTTNPYDYTFRFVCDGSDNLKLFHRNFDPTTNTNARTMTMLDFERDETDLSFGKVTLFQTGVISSQINSTNNLDNTLYFAFKHTDSSHEQIKLRDNSDIYMGGREISFFIEDTIRANEFIRIKNDRTMKFWVGNSDTDNNESLRITCTTPANNTRIDLCGNIHISTDRRANPDVTDIPCLVLKNGGTSGNTTASQIKFCYANKLDEQFPSYISSRSNGTTSNDNALDFRISNGTKYPSIGAINGTALALTLTGAGRVGIGKTNPSEALDVVGSISASSNLSITGNATITGNLTVTGDVTGDVSGNVTVGSGKTLHVSSGTLTTSAEQNKNIIQGAASDLNIGDYNFKAGTITSTGNVGIGTIVPSEALDVSGNIRNKVLTIYDNGTNDRYAYIKHSSLDDASYGLLFDKDYGSVYINSSSSFDSAFSWKKRGIFFQNEGTTAMYIDGSFNKGYVGIGTTLPSEALDVIGSISASSNLSITGNATITGNLTVNGTTTTIDTNNMVVKDSLIELSNGTTGTPGNDAGIVIERGTQNNAFMGWDESADKFIMGTTTATGATTGDLSVTRGTLVSDLEGNLTGDVTGNLEGNVTVGIGQTLTVSSGTLTTSAEQNKNIIQGAASDLDIGNYNFKAGTISSTGNIDCTGNQIHIDKSVSENIYFAGTADNTNFQGSHNIRLKANGGQMQFYTKPSGSDTQRMCILSGGNVGIGTTNPQTALEISSSSGLRLTNTTVKTSANDRIGYIDFENLGKGVGAAIESCVNVVGDNNADLRFMTTLDLNNKYVERMRIDRAGNVGIGTMEPTTQLDISGELKSKTVSIEPNGLLYNPNQSRPMGLVIANETTTPNEFAALHLSNRGDTHSTARTIFQIDLQDINTGSGAGQRKIMFTGRTGISTSDKTNFMTFDVNGGGVGIGAVGIGTEDGDTGSLNPNDGGYISALNSIRVRVPRNTCQVYGNEGLTVSGIQLTGTRTAVLRLGSPYQNSHDAYCAKITSTNNQSTTYAADLRFYTSSTNTASAPERMCIATNGNVGIGTVNPVNAGLAVYKAVTQTTGVTHYYFHSSTTIQTSPDTAAGETEPSVRTISIYAANAIWANGVVMSSSDERIKTNIQDISDNDALNTLRKIQPKIYDYKDKVERGNATTYGFIAQQIRDVLPDATTKTSELIPNIYELVDITTSNNLYNVITFTNFDTNDLDSSSNNVTVLDSDMKRHTVEITEIIDNKTIRVDTDLLEWMGAVDVSNETVIANEVQTYKKVILDASNNVVLENYDITSIASMDASDNVVGNKADLTGDNTIDSSNNYVDASGNFIAAVNSDGHYIDASGNYFDTNGNFMDASNNLVGTYKTEWKKVTINGTKIFVYGQTVNDFHTLNKSAIFTVATAALQEVDRQLQAEKAKVSVLESDLTAEKAKTATLESQMADLLTRVSALESA